MGMLGPAAYLVLALDAFGPIVDNAAGIVEMTVGRERPDVRGRTVVLDAVGNTVKAFTKAWAGGAAALGSMLLVAAYLDEVRRRLAPAAGRLLAGRRRRRRGRELVLHPRAARRCFLGGGGRDRACALWLALRRCIIGVARPARRLMDEVRRQLKDRPADFVPDHEACIDVVSRAALRHMLAPAVVAVLAPGVPVVVGVALRFARAEDNPLVLADSVAALVLAGTIAGVLGSSSLLGLRGRRLGQREEVHRDRQRTAAATSWTQSRARAWTTPTYAAALVGDTLGDPLKDPRGARAMHVLVKNASPVITIVLLAVLRLELGASAH